MGFGSGAQDSPLDEDTPDPDPDPDSTQIEPESDEARHNSDQAVKTDSSMDSTGSTATHSTGNGRTVVDFTDVDVSDHHTTAELAKMLMATDYHSENPQVPYAMWRDGTSTGRDRTSLEMNPEVDDLVTVVRREFEDRYDAQINKADLREFALVYGLMHADEIFEMAEEWGLQYNS